MLERSKAISWRLSLIILIYLVLATLYSVITPIGRGADEWAHYWYARFIAEHGRLPANFAEREAAGYKSDWPPLYHLLAAGLTAWVETDGPPTFKYREDNIRRQMVPAQGPEAILHTQDELFPWRQEILIWHLGRFLSIALSTGTLLVTYGLARDLFSPIYHPTQAGDVPSLPSPTAELLSLATVAVLAFNPRFLFTGMLFNYDSLTLLLASLFLWLCIRIVKGSHLRWGFWVLGAVAGLALVTKYLTALLPLVILFLAFRLSRESSRPLSQMGRQLGQALLAYLLVVSGWFGYLLITFNEIEQYGPVLGTLAPLIRGDGSDRTVEEIFAWMSGGQSPPPDYIEKPQRSLWQIMAELPLTLWGNPITRPYPLNSFIGLMAGVTLIAGIGLIWGWRSPARRPTLPLPLARLLLLFCCLPLPFMIIRLFGARDPLEAVQGRHLLFLSGPALAVLLVWGLWALAVGWVERRETQHPQGSRGAQIFRTTHHAPRFSFYILLALLLTGAISQLILMWQTYPRPLPVQTTPYSLSEMQETLPRQVTLPGGARLIDFFLSDQTGTVLEVGLIWEAGSEPAPEDYQTELLLVDAGGEVRQGWRGYQTEAHYPTRLWEAGDIIEDKGWLPLVGLPEGEYEIRLRLLNNRDEVVEELPLASYSLARRVAGPEAGWLLWSHGRVAPRPPLLRERETVQLSFISGTLLPRLIGPAGIARRPVIRGGNWANFIIEPDWPAGLYRLTGQKDPLFWVAESRRTFEIPPISVPLEANFDGKIKLLGYDLPSRRVQAGEGVPVTLYWQGLEWLGEEFVIFTRLLDNQQVAWGGYDRLARENYSTLLWAPEEIVVDGFAVSVAPDAPEGIYTLSIGWYRLVEGEAQSLPLIDPATGQPTDLTSVMLGPVKIGGPPSGIALEEAAPQIEQNIRVGEEIELLGFDLATDPAGEWTNEKAVSIHLTLYWRALTNPAENYTVFIHLRHQGGEIISQIDSPPAQGRYPTGLWEAGEIIRDEVTLPPISLAAGQYELVIGMYQFATGERLLVPDSPDGTLRLLSFEVEQ